MSALEPTLALHVHHAFALPVVHIGLSQSPTLSLCLALFAVYVYVCGVSVTVCVCLYRDRAGPYHLSMSMTFSLFLHCIVYCLLPIAFLIYSSQACYS